MTTIKEEVLRTRTVKVKTSIGLRWRHLTTTLMRQTIEKWEAPTLTGGEMKRTSEEVLTIVGATEAGGEVEEALDLSMNQMKTLTSTKVLDGEEEVSGTTERTRLHLAEVAEVRGRAEVEAVEVTICQPRIRRPWLLVTPMPGLGTGRVLTLGVVILTSPGGQSARNAALLSLERTTPTPHPTCLRYRILETPT